MAISLKESFEKVDIFKQTNPASLSALASCGYIKKYKKGEILFLDKETINTIYIVISGFVSLYKISSQGEKKVIFVLGEGQLVNEVILQDLPESVNCEVFEEAYILIFQKQDLLRVMEQDFELTKSVIDSLSLKVRRLYRQLKNTSGSVRGDKRVAAKLWKLSADFGKQSENGAFIDMEMSITYLADMLGSKRETVSRQLKILSEQGLVIIKENHFIIPNRDKLANYFKMP